ncbi:MAG: haloacid dehalogenase-like hydrolase [Phycisphaeraceae bacterium]|nr:haloacid dehalogenase-like hydrolase [Phycisphaeraceae bacterium]MBX3366904.1 haloacid dehalogenase-like hydrolase [Phycisphaeraceae bacterium]QYK49789.1 MAG: haloacid dehalogenase-like hydrolase [Phycisphaeraceae bacterium]
MAARHVLSMTLLVVISLVTGCRSSGSHAANALPSWSDTPTRASIVDFVERVTDKSTPDYVPPAERIAVFDNDGTLWAEQPMYFQLAFALDRVKALAPTHPEWQTTEPFASILKGDVKSALAGGEKSIAAIVAASHSGMTTDEFNTIVKDWLRTAKHPTLNRPYTQCVYQPMLELLAYLRANKFKTFIVSGGGVEFMRAFAEEVYGIPPEQVIGSRGKVAFSLTDNDPARPVLTKLPDIDFIDDGPGKPIGMNAAIGRRPTFAAGNSDGDHQMLQWTAAGPGARLCLLVHHTDADREWAYDRDSHIGRLDKALDEAIARHWIIVNMSSDWRKVFPHP